MVFLIAACCTLPLCAQPRMTSNPALSLFPKDTQVDWPYWYYAMPHISRTLAAAKVTHVAVMPEILEQEPPSERDWNDTQDTAEFLDNFGRTRNPLLMVHGVLCDSITTDLGRLEEAPQDDNGSIPLAVDAVLGVGDRIRLQAMIGDGPHGSEGSDRGDYDFYYIGHVEAGQLVTAQIRTPLTSTQRLDTKVGLYDAFGRLIEYNDDGMIGDPDSFLELRPMESGDYWVAVRGVNSAWPADPFDSASGPKAGSEGQYTLTLGLEAQDMDYYSFDLEAGDVISAGVDGEVRYILLFDGSTTLRKATDTNWSGVYPASTPLIQDGNANIAAVATSAGRYAIAATRGAGDYALQLGVFRPPLFTDLAPQELFVDFDGAAFDATGLGGHADAQLSPLRVFLEEHQLGSEEDAIIDVAMAAIRENVVADLTGAHTPVFSLEIRNSRDHADRWGETNVSRVIVGGTQEELGIKTIGISESIDVGNFETEETAIVLLDFLVDPDDANSPASVPFAAPMTVADVIGLAIGTIVSHEAGHLFASFHTGYPGIRDDLMTAGNDPVTLMGLGVDGVLGTPDDEDIDYAESPFNKLEPFTGLQDTPGAIVFGLYGPAQTAQWPGLQPARGTLLTATWPNPVSSALHLSGSVDTREELVLELYDVLGRRVQAQRHSLGPGEFHLVMSVQDLSAGAYVLRATGHSRMVTRKVIVAR